MTAPTATAPTGEAARCARHRAPLRTAPRGAFACGRGCVTLPDVVEARAAARGARVALVSDGTGAVAVRLVRPVLAAPSGVLAA